MLESNSAATILCLIGSILPPGRAPKTLTRDLRLRADLGLDSLRLVALVVQFEERLGINLAAAGDIDFASIQTVGDVLDIGQELVRRERALG